MGIFAITWPKTSGGWCMAQFTYPTRPSQPVKQRAAILATQVRMRFFFVPSIILLLRHLIHLEIALWCYSKGIRNPVEEGEHRGDIYSFRDLRLRPAMIPQSLHILVGGAIRRFRHLRHIVKQGMLCEAQAGFFQFAVRYRLHHILVCSLNTQEVCMGVQSIRTAIEPRNPARNCLLGPSVQMSVGKVNRIAEFDHVAQEVGAVAEALQNAGHLLSARLGTPFVVDRGHFASGVAIFDQLDFGFVVGVDHALFLRSIPQYSTTDGRRTSTSRCTGNLEDKTLVVLLQGNALTVEVLEEGDRIFAGEAGQLLETSNIHQATAKWSKLRGESAKSGRVDK